MQHVGFARVLTPMHALSLFVLAALLASCMATPATSPPASGTPPAASSSPASASASTAPSPGESSLEGQLAYVAGVDPQIHLLDLASGESRQLTELRPEHAELTASGPMRPALTCGFGPYALSWSPDGKRLAFTYGSCDSVVYVVDLEGNLRRIGDGRGPAWSPDGTRLIHGANVPYSPCGPGCMADPPEPWAWDLRIVDIAEAGESRPLTDDGSTAVAGSPAWSPDGTVIAYSGPPQGAGPEIFGATYLVGADGSDARLLANGGYPSGWLADGRLLITRERDGSVHAVDIESGESDQLGGEQTASVSPDGALALVWTTDPVSGSSGLRLLTSDGQLLAELPGSFGAWSPESTAFAAFTPEGSLHIVSRAGDLVASFEIGSAGFSAAWRPGPGS